MDLLWISMGSFCEKKKWASDSHRSRQVFSCWLDSQKTCFLECGGWIATSFFLNVVAGKPWSFKWLDSPACRWWSCRHEAQGKHSKYAREKKETCAWPWRWDAAHLPFGNHAAQQILLGENQCLWSAAVCCCSNDEWCKRTGPPHSGQTWR